MIRTRKSITIDRPVDEVFEYMAHFENDMEWRNELLEIERVSEVPEGPGTKYRQRVNYEGYEGTETFEVTGFEPNRRVTYTGRDGDIIESGEYRFTPEDGRTRVEVSADLQLAGGLAPAEPEISDAVRRQTDLDLDHLKDILEHREKWRQR